MPIQEQAFVDVRVALRQGGSTAPLHFRADEVRVLEQAIGMVRSTAIVYFSPGEYWLHPTRDVYGAWQGDLELGAGVTLWMDPDAKIVIQEARLVLMGGLIAPTSHIFDERGSGMVLIGGDLKELFPEWWGATGDPLHDDSDAIQRAIDVGSARRMPQSSVSTHRGKLRRPISVTLRQMYSVGRTLVMGRSLAPSSRDTLLTGFGASSGVSTTLRGLVTGMPEHAVGLRAIDWQVPEAGPEAGALVRALERSLLRLDLAYGSLVEDLTLDANEQIDYALLINSGIGEPIREQTHAITVRGCTFRGARNTQIQIGPPQLRADAQTRPLTVMVGSDREKLRIPAELVTTGNGDIPGLSVRNCVVECRSIDGLAPPRGMHFRTGNGVALRVADTAFRGPTLSYLDITSGMVLVEGCDFNSPTPKAKMPVPKSSVPSSGFEDPTGEDVYLGASGSLANESPPQPGSGYVAMSSCTSRSETMLGTPNPSQQGINNGRPTRSNLVLGCRHEPPTVGALVSIRWGRTAVGSVALLNSRRVYGSDGTLCVVGSYLGGEMQVVTRAAQSVFLACHTVRGWNQPRIIAPPSPGTRSMTTVIFGLQCVAVLLVLLSCIGCQRDAEMTPVDAAVDLGGVSPSDGYLPDDTDIILRADTGARVDARARPDVVISDPPDSGEREDVATMDAPTNHVTDAEADAGGAARDIVVPRVDVFESTTDVACSTDATSRQIDSFDWVNFDVPQDLLISEYDVSHDGYRSPPRDVIQRDIEVTRFGNPPVVAEYGPPRQSRAMCTEITDGDTNIAAPRLIFPMSPMRVTSQRPTLFWSLPPGVEGAQIDLCRDRCCMQVIQSIDALGTSVRVPEALPAGVVYWRARGRVGRRHGRETSFTWEFGVRHRGAPTDTAWGTIKDFNGDGYDDVVNPIYQGGPYGDPTQVRVYWGGHDGLAEGRFQAIEVGGGSPQAITGDFNGDGLADTILTLGPLTYTGEGGQQMTGRNAWVIYGDRTRLRAPTEQFRVGVVGLVAGDFNGDGFSDVTFAAPRLTVEGGLHGRSMTIFGGPGGLHPAQVQYTLSPLGIQQRNCYGSNGSAGDQNGDGYADLVVSDFCFNNSRGRAMVMPGGPGGIRYEVLRNLDPESFGGQPFGGAMRFAAGHGGVGDLDGDRIGDYVITNDSWSFVDIYRGDRGCIFRFDRTISPIVPDRGYGVNAFGGGLSDPADLDGDGLAELILGCPSCGTNQPSDPEWGRGFVFVYRPSAHSSGRLFPDLILRGYNDGWDFSSTFGLDVASGDYDGDGFDDIVIGDPESYETWNAPYRGKLHVVFGSPVWGAFRRSVVFGQSVSGSEGIGGTLAAISGLRAGTGG